MTPVHVKTRKHQRNVISSEQTVLIILWSSMHHYSLFLRWKFPILLLVRIKTPGPTYTVGVIMIDRVYGILLARGHSIS